MTVICFICRGALVFSPPAGGRNQKSLDCHGDFSELWRALGKAATRRTRPPPIGDNRTYKYHICAKCWPVLLAWLREAQKAADQARAEERYAAAECRLKAKEARPVGDDPDIAILAGRLPRRKAQKSALSGRKKGRKAHRNAPSTLLPGH